jgi:hypothetical protein
MEMAGLIKDLERQVEFELIPEQREPDTVGKRGAIHKGKLLEKPIKYIADFQYTDVKTGEVITEDVKGYKREGAYKLFVVKRKLMLYLLGIRIKEV